jgi:hypothetical protein
LSISPSTGAPSSIDSSSFSLDIMLFGIFQASLFFPVSTHPMRRYNHAAWSITRPPAEIMRCCFWKWLIAPDTSFVQVVL